MFIYRKVVLRYRLCPTRGTVFTFIYTFLVAGAPRGTLDVPCTFRAWKRKSKADLPGKVDRTTEDSKYMYKKIYPYMS